MSEADDKGKEIRRDLETIKELLNDEDVPTLDDTIELEPEESALPEATFKSLLSDAWRESVEGLFEDRDDLPIPEDTDSLTIALMPHRVRACGACSRDEPHPKLPFAFMTLTSSQQSGPLSVT